MTRISKEPAVRRQELVDIAQRLFIAKGYEATSVRDILKEVSGAPGMFYHYFSSKEEIYKAAMTQYIEGYVTKINGILCDKAVSVPERVQKLMQLIRTTFAEYLSASSFNHYTPESYAYDVMVSMKILNQIADSVESFIIEVIKLGHVQNRAALNQNTRQLAFFILYGIYGILHDCSEDGLSVELIEKNMRGIIPLVSRVLDIPAEVFMKGGE